MAPLFVSVRVRGVYALQTCEWWLMMQASASGQQPQQAPEQPSRGARGSGHEPAEGPAYVTANVAACVGLPVASGSGAIVILGQRR